MSKIKIQPLDDNILIKRDKPVERTAGGILLARPEEKMERGTVISFGNDVQSVKKGDEILFKNYSLDIIEVDGEEFTFIKRENIIALIN